MDRRRLLVIAAALVAALGAALVFLYVRTADQRAADRFDTVPVLRATQVIEPGESIDDALRTGKVAQQSVVRDAKIASALTDTTSIADLTEDPDLRAEIEAAIEDANAAVSKAESIRKFRILPEDWTEEGGQLTPSLKLKRNVVMRECRDEIEALYL